VVINLDDSSKLGVVVVSTVDKTTKFFSTNHFYNAIWAEVTASSSATAYLNVVGSFSFSQIGLVVVKSN
jgi:hypothetical protein